MSRLLIRGCCMILVLAVGACNPSSSAAPKHPRAEARNGETGKKPRKQQPPLVAPPPAYGNKIVQNASLERAEGSSLASVDAASL